MKISLNNVPHYLRHVDALKIDDAKFIRLTYLERKMHVAAERHCNGDITEESYDRVHNFVAKEVAKVVPHLADQLYLNGDPRGYALKLNEKASLTVSGAYKDWGGYVILAPEF